MEVIPGSLLNPSIFFGMVVSGKPEKFCADYQRLLYNTMGIIPSKGETCENSQVSDFCHDGIDNMKSREIARKRILNFIDEIYGSYREFEDELGLKRNTVSEWKRGISTYMDILPEIADAFGVTTDYLLGRDDTGIPNVYNVPLLGSIQAGYPVESFADSTEYIKVPFPTVLNDYQYFALRVVGDSMMPLVVEGDIIICVKTNDVNDKICAVTVDNESTLKRVRIDSTGVTLIPTNPMYKELHYSARKAEELGFHVDGVLVQMIRNF